MGYPQTRDISRFPHGKTWQPGIEVSGKGRMLLSASRLQLFGEIQKWPM